MTFPELKISLSLSLDRMLRFLDNKPEPENGHYPYWVHTVDKEIMILRKRLDEMEEWLKGEEK